MSLIGAAALATGLFFLRQHKQVEPGRLVKAVPPGEEVPTEIQLDKLRELGI